MTKKYKLTDETKNILYGVFRIYGLERLVSTEKELNGMFKGLTDMEFVNRITTEVRK
ncbi:hypothetical protein SD074_16080 [Prolixibacter sp. SD074]|nr:hypothetical protein SD074_16080 [Prolixibacter sp. SD074]